MKTGEKIKELRKQRGLSQQELAEMTGYTDRSSISKIEAGMVDLTQSKIVLFAAALCVKPHELIGDDLAIDILSEAGCQEELAVACELRLPVEAVRQVIKTKQPAETYEIIEKVMSMLAEELGGIERRLTFHEYYVLLRYNALSNRDRALVDSILEPEANK